MSASEPLPGARFHLAFPVDDLAAAEAFYAVLLGCPIGRRSQAWIDFDLGGNQLTAHLVSGTEQGVGSNPVDGDQVPVRHFGLVLPWEVWEALAERLAAAGAAFQISPRVRFVGEVGEQGTFFIHDPAGNALEFKAFRDPRRLFAR
ncbi:VOC family protein [Engelhardtia mirabilis]|uniref:Glyoxalase-like domain protein n=1 Tax=Engelhardtia mirabilis TaxID=2528011 RepID=A0A518BHU5_9BACT|nr:Glyoxalase-like domain protein [Planctomycetes bacterium Pla133]QDV00883.1 Glyoxalase-like domain protein [Planctomycetes bacterium Pla86]